MCRRKTFSLPLFILIMFIGRDCTLGSNIHSHDDIIGPVRGVMGMSKIYCLAIFVENKNRTRLFKLD